MVTKSFHSQILKQFFSQMTANHPARISVPADKKSWSVFWPDYHPVKWVSTKAGKSYCDPEIRTPGFSPRFNHIDGNVDRRSHTGNYQVVNGFPLNPCGRTGACMRSRLGRWGPNHAADPVVTKWMSNESGVDRNVSVLLIKRRDNKCWALPGGMMEFGEDPRDTASREFLEETMDIMKASPDEKKKIESKLGPLFASGVLVWKGVIEADHRCTDNVWIESVAYHFHDEVGILDEMTIKSGDDAVEAKWFKANKDLEKILIAQHALMVQKAVERLKVEW